MKSIAYKCKLCGFSGSIAALSKHTVVLFCLLSSLIKFLKFPQLSVWLLQFWQQYCGKGNWDEEYVFSFSLPPVSDQLEIPSLFFWAVKMTDNMPHAKYEPCGSQRCESPHPPVGSWLHWAWEAQLGAEIGAELQNLKPNVNFVILWSCLDFWFYLPQRLWVFRFKGLL